jgi:hypothetical protein
MKMGILPTSEIAAVLIGVICMKKFYLINLISETSASCGMLRCVSGVMVPDVSNDHSDFTFRIKQYKLIL